MRHIASALAASLLLLGGCGRSVATPEPPPSDVTADSVRATTEVSVGGNIEVFIDLSNAGNEPTAKTKLQFVDIDDYADIVGCTPSCDLDDFLGTFATLPGVPAGGEAHYAVEFVATAVGAARWRVCIYDGIGEDSQQIFCGDIVTVIR